MASEPLRSAAVDELLGFVPGYDLANCAIAGGCGGIGWGVAVIGAIPGGKGWGIAAKATANQLADFNVARNVAVKWLEARGFRAEQATIGKFGENAGRAVGMRTSDGKIGFRVEFDGRHGAHINVWAGGQKETFMFDGSQSMVNRIIRQFTKE